MSLDLGIGIFLYNVGVDGQCPFLHFTLKPRVSASFSKSST